MMDFCGFLQGKSSEFAWILEIPYTMHPLKESPILSKHQGFFTPLEPSEDLEEQSKITENTRTLEHQRISLVTEDQGKWKHQGMEDQRRSPAVRIRAVSHLLLSRAWKKG